MVSLRSSKVKFTTNCLSAIMLPFELRTVLPRDGCASSIISFLYLPRVCGSEKPAALSQRSRRARQGWIQAADALVYRRSTTRHKPRELENSQSAGLRALPPVIVRVDRHQTQRFEPSCLGSAASPSCLRFQYPNKTRYNATDYTVTHWITDSQGLISRVLRGRLGIAARPIAQTVYVMPQFGLFEATLWNQGGASRRGNHKK